MARIRDREKLVHEMTILSRPGLIDELCEHQASGEGLVIWCHKAGIRYGMVRAWIEADSDRMRRFEAAERHRADLRAAAIDAMARKLLDPAAETGHPWVDRDKRFDEDGNPVADSLDPRAARAALDALKWGAITDAPKRYGRSIEHNHTHRLAEDHLLAMRSLVHGGGNGARNPALAAPVAEVPAVDFRVLTDAPARDEAPDRSEFLVPVVESLLPPAAPAGGWRAFTRWTPQFPRRVG